MTLGNRRRAGYLPIGDYGVIGDCRSAALVGVDGSIDWLCLPRFDSPSLFGRILDAEVAGYWQIAPAGPYDVTQRYHDRTNLLRTTFTTGSGMLSVTDFMPTARETVGHHASPHPGARVVRIVDCLAGEVDVLHDIAPAPDYARRRMELHTEGDYIHGETGTHHVCVHTTVHLDAPSAQFHLQAGDTAAFGLRFDEDRQCRPGPWTLERARELFRETKEFWWEWIGECHYEGPFQEPVWRSALALKLMTYAPTGAIIAAPTTSLPEKIGGSRNWDYRFTWLRDASFTLYAFFQLGLTSEADGFFRWLTKLRLGARESDIPNLYTVDGSDDVAEFELPHLSGHKGSRPVRIGNAAVDQLQLDVYGEVLDSAYLYARFGRQISQSLWRELRAIVELACRRWQEPDASIWETRHGNRQFTYSKVMCWVAVDRGIRIAERFGLPFDKRYWYASRRAIHRAVTQQGYSEELSSFTQYFGGTELDASLLRMSQVRFLRDRDPRIMSTVQVIARELGEGVLVRRYRLGPDDVGPKSGEGAFLMCSFWLADALAHIGEVEEAEQLFERLLAFGAPPALFAEEADTVNGALLGNYPQAFTHLALVGAAVNIERARNSALSAPRLHRKGPTTDRSRRGATTEQPGHGAGTRAGAI